MHEHDMHSMNTKQEDHQVMGHEMPSPEQKRTGHEGTGHEMHAGMNMKPEEKMEGMPEGKMAGGHDHHAMMIADFKRRFWVSSFLPFRFFSFPAKYRDCLE